MVYQRRHPDPIFMFGALRSGTTLLRLMLARHSKVYSPGETDYLFDHLSPSAGAPRGWQCDREALSGDWKFHMAKINLPEGMEGGDLVYALNDIIHDTASNKLVTVSVHRNALAIADLFPNAKYIHLLRDPRDSARSAVGMGWDGNSYEGVRHWVDTERSWDLTNIPKDQVMTVAFEELIQDPEKWLTQICIFLGLEFEPSMLDYHRTSTYSPPDPSISQKWRMRATTREIALIEGRVGPLLRARGYEPAGKPIIPGKFEKAWLKIDNVFNRWKYNIRRYGFGLFISAHLARILRIKPLSRKLESQQLDIRIQNLK